MKWISWLNAALGGWIALSPWLLGFNEINLALWSNTILGLSIILVNLWAIYGESVGH